MTSTGPFHNFPSFRPFPEGLNLRLPHLPRDELVEKLYNGIRTTAIVLLSSSSASGKTSLLTMFAHRHSELRCVFIAFPRGNASEVLVENGVDLAQQKCSIPDDKMCVFMLDDCQRQDRDVAFWTRLIKNSSSWLPSHVRFIISATHLLKTDDPESPVALNSIPWKLTRDDFLITDEEAHQCFCMENGLPSKLRFPTLMEVIIRECNGHIGSLRISIDEIYVHFREVVDPTEKDVLEFYLSADFLQVMGRCFGSGRTTLDMDISNQQMFLSKWVVCDSIAQPILQQLSRDEHQCFTLLKKTGIVTEVGGCVKFASPLAERYYYKWLFPGLGNANPTSLHELIRKAIESMSATALRQSVVRKDEFPKEAVFQLQFVAAIALHTRMSYICPEISRVPSSTLHTHRWRD